MKNRLIIIALALIVLIGAGYLFTRSHHRVAAFGDSLTYGLGSTQAGGYVTLLSQSLNLKIENFGVSGNTTADALARIDQVLAARPTATILLLGGNDYLQGKPETEIFKNLSTIIEKLEAGGSKVLLLGLDSGVPGNNDNALFEGLSLKYKTAYIPNILNGISAHPELMSDKLHPNQAGYAIMANRIQPVLAGLLK